MLKKTIIILLIIFVLIVIISLRLLSSGLIKNTKPKACTMEAKLCPDGSAVGRSGSNCEFTPCP